MKKPMIISGVSLVLPYLVVLLFLLIDYQDESQVFAYLAAVFSILLAVGPIVSFLEGKRIIQTAAGMRGRIFGGIVCAASLMVLLFGFWFVYAIVKAIAYVNVSQSF